ncbi:hypothetical protein [Vibrio harveyi]|uniref:hypothetical protein n=1 Tax=Vibrio harveyi TaxID=669 RepID=UPI00217D8FC2|nr:hypothetical protein [Vibrio harveyi]
MFSAIPFFVRVNTDFATTKSINFQVVGANKADFSDKFIIEESGPVLLADLKAGYAWKGRLNHHKPCQYIAFNYVPDTDATAGTVTAAFALYNEFHAGNYKSSGKVTISGK